ncbi:FxLD family lanthipeptide [Longispora sp. NPDC051575]
MNNDDLTDDYRLDVSLVDAGTASGFATSTDDSCGSGGTGSSACPTNSNH